MMLARLVPAITMPSFIKRRASEICAGAFATFGSVLLVALLTYHSEDPSLNHLSDVAARNALGEFGATLADMLKQTIGWMSVLVLLTVV